MYAEFNNLGIIKDNELIQFRALNSRLQGHTSIKYIPEVDITTGLLGQGLSYGVGMAIAKKIKKSDNMIYVMTGDGELHEGQIWEAMMEASHYKLDNLVLIIDRNKLCSHQNVENVISLEPLDKRIEAFGWDIFTIYNGHSMNNIHEAFQWAQNKKQKSAKKNKGRMLFVRQPHAGLGRRIYAHSCVFSRKGARCGKRRRGVHSGCGTGRAHGRGHAAAVRSRRDAQFYGGNETICDQRQRHRHLSRSAYLALLQQNTPLFGRVFCLPDNDESAGGGLYRDVPPPKNTKKSCAVHYSHAVRSVLSARLRRKKTAARRGVQIYDRYSGERKELCIQNLY